MSDDILSLEERLTDPLWDAVSENLYTTQEKQKLKSLKKFARLDKKLSEMGENGYDRFSKLDVNIQDGLRWFNSGQEAVYMKAPSAWWQTAGRAALSGVLNFNPLGTAYNLAVQYGNLLNTGLNTMMQVAENDKSFLDMDVWANSWSNGESLYNQELDKKLQEKHGKIRSFIAKQHLAGKTRAEMIANYSNSFSQEFINELIDFSNNEKQWENGILEDYRQAKLSPGRYIARRLVGIRGEDETGFGLGGFRFGSPMAASQEAEDIRTGKKKLTKKEKDLMFTRVSGFTDATAQIFADPLTYVTFGVGAGVRFFGKGVSETSRVIDLASKGTAGIRKAFKISPKLRKTWDDYGALVEQYSNASKAGNIDEVNRIVQEIRIKFPEFSADEVIKFNADGKVFNAQRASDFYSDVDRAGRLLTGNLSGTDFFRDAIVVHRANRGAVDAARRVWYNLGSQEGVTAKEAKMSLDELAAYGEDIGFAKTLDDTQFAEYTKERKRFIKRLTAVLSRSPGNQPIKVGEDAIDTIDTVRFLFRSVVTRNVADISAQLFLQLNKAEQISVLRGLYRSVMESYGVPEAEIGEILGKRFGSEDETLSIAGNLKDPHTGLPIEYGGAGIDRDLRSVIANLPWEHIQKASANAALGSGGETGRYKLRVFNLLGGASNNSAVSAITRGWSLGTLFPKLGIRASIDEAFFFSITAPGYVLKQYFSALKASKIATAASSDKVSQGVVAGLFRKVASKTTGIKRFDPVNLLSKEVRARIRERVMLDAEKFGWTENQTYEVLKIAFVDEAINEIGTLGLSAQKIDDLRQLLVHNVSFLNAASSTAARATATGGVVDDISKIAILDDIAMAKMIDDFNVEFGEVFKEVDPSRFKKNSIVVPMFYSFNRFFKNNKLGDIDLGEVFVKHNGLRTEDDWKNATDEVINALDDKQKAYIISERSQLQPQVKAGMSNDAIIRDTLLKRIFSDMYFVFHGTDKSVARGGSFNNQLLQHFQNGRQLGYSHDDIARLDFEEYFDLVQGHTYDRKFRTNISQMQDFQNTPDKWQKLITFENSIWEMMDRTVNGFVRQKGVLMWYFARREKYRAFESEYTQKVFDGLTGNAFRYSDVVANPNKYDNKVKTALLRAQTMTEKFYTEAALNDAINNTLKYVDNPNVRTYLASSVKNVNRFYRAIEDFYRRVYRLKNVSTRVLYRMRLMNLGLNNAGIVHTDDEGVQYYTIPIDNIIYAAINPVLTKLSGGNTEMLQPKFLETTGKIIGLNPSFQDSGGIPYLSGPMASIGTLGLKAIAGRVFETSPWVEDIDNVLLGDIGDDIDVYKAVTPAFLQRVFKALDRDENARHNHSAVLQAIAFNAAFDGMNHPGMSPNATNRQKQEYLDIVRIGAHNIQTANALLGLVWPSSVSLQESTNMQDYLRDTGSTNIRSEFFELYDAIVKKYGDDVSDPYQLAIAMFVGQNPNKLIYTASREDKAVKPLLRKTEEVRDWLIANKAFVKKYGEASYLFAPQTEGKINPSVYNWMSAAGLADSVEVKDYLDTINILQVKSRFFQISKNLEDKLDKVADYSERKLLIENAENKRAMMKAAYPLLAEQLGENGEFTVEWEKGVLRDLEELVNDNTTPVPATQRKFLKQMINIFNSGYSTLNISYSNDDAYYAIKYSAKERMVKELTAIAGNSPFLKQINDLVFFSLIDFKARDTFRTTPYGR
jgi:hypothetical protein